MSTRTNARTQPKKASQHKQPQKIATPVAAPKRDAQALAEVRSREEAKQQARLERQAMARAEAAKRRRAKLMRNVAIAALAVVVIVGGIIAYTINEANKPGQFVPMQPSAHISTTDAPHAPYVSDPPTSGPHVSSVPSWGVSDTQVAKELQVHALEDAGVVINYRPDLDKATVDRLATLARSYDKEIFMSPYAGLSDPIVLTAWTRIERLPAFDEAQIKKFINAYRGIDHHRDSGS